MRLVFPDGHDEQSQVLNSSFPAHLDMANYEKAVDLMQKFPEPLAAAHFYSPFVNHLDGDSDKKYEKDRPFHSLISKHDWYTVRPGCNHSWSRPLCVDYSPVVGYNTSKVHGLWIEHKFQANRPPCVP